MDIKYVSRKCIEENPNETQYYQITAIDEYSRKRVAAIVDEKSVTHTSEFLLTLESKMGFKINTVQTDMVESLRIWEAVNESVSLMW